MIFRHTLLFLFLALLAPPLTCFALTPNEILVIANRNAAKSIGLAKYYMEQRNIPETNLLIVWAPDKEVCSRKGYDVQIAEKVRLFLRKKNLQKNIRCLVTIFGIPLKIDPPQMTTDEERTYNSLKDQYKTQYEKLKEIDKDDLQIKKAAEAALTDLKNQMNDLNRNDQRAALDSELALVMADDYSLDRWIPNPYFVGFANQNTPINQEKVLWVSRLDGPTTEIVKRIIDDSIAAEQEGLDGTAFFDARGPMPEPDKQVTGYALYDKSIHLAAKRLKRGRKPKKVVIDDQQALFQPGQCPQAALYCGWYSLGRYADAFDWVKGAVGYHIASSECSTLKNFNSQVWCKRMLEDGVAAVIGPTSEPYVQAFPIPEVFFGLLTDGKLSLMECYAAATPFLSWQMVLIGDPLYRPFKNQSTHLK